MSDGSPRSGESATPGDAAPEPIVPADAPHEVIAAAVDRNWRASVKAFGLAPTTLVRDDDELFWYVTGLPDAAFNSIMYANLAPERIDAAVEELQWLRRLYDVPMGWLIGPSSRPADLGERLAARGLVHRTTLTPMTVALASVQAGPSTVPGSAAEAGGIEGLSVEAGTVPGLTVERVRDAAVLEAWIAAEARGFQSTGPVGRGLMALRRGMGVGHGYPLTHLLGRLDGRPVATASALLAGGIVGIFDVATVPAARGRGIGTAMTLAALEVGRSAGYEIAFLQPSAMGRRLYERLGFRQRCTCQVFG
jgi:GNAT superfamily N-acetyltransferase